MKLSFLLRSLVLLSATLAASPAHGQSSSSGSYYSSYSYPMYYPSGPLGTVQVPGGSVGIEVPIERTGHYFSFNWRTTAGSPVNTYYTSSMGFVTASGSGASAVMRSFRVSAYTPSSYVSTPVTYTYPGYTYMSGGTTYTYPGYTYTYSTYTSVPFSCFEWWLTDAMTNQESYHRFYTPQQYEDLRSDSWSQPGGMPIRNFAIPDSRLGHALVAGSTAGGWSPVTSGYYTFGTYASGTTGAPVSLHWFTGSAPVGYGDFSIADLTDGTKAPLNQTNVSGASWVHDYSVYPSASVTFYLPAAEMNNLYVLHYQIPGQVAAAMPLWPTAVGAAFPTATVNAGPKTIPAGAATVTGAIAVGANFWLTRNMDNSSSPAPPAFFTLTPAVASSATPKRWWLAPPPAAATWDLVTFGIASTRAAQSFTVSQPSSVSPATPGSTESRPVLTYEDYAVNSSANSFHYFTVTALVNRAEAFNLVAHTGSATEVFSNRQVWVLDGWTPIGGKAGTLPVGTPGQFSFALTVAGPDPVAGLTLTAPNGALYPLIPSALSSLTLDDLWHPGTPWTATQRTWTLAQAYTGPMGDWSLTNPTAGHDWNLILNVGNTTDYIRDLGYQAKVKPVALQISLSRWAFDTAPRLRLRQRDGSDYPVTAGNTTEWTSQAPNGTVWISSAYVFHADSYARDGVDYWLYDEETGEESPYNTTNLITWFALPTPAGLAGAVNAQTGTIDLQWPLGLAALEGGFEIERLLSGETVWQTIDTLAANKVDVSDVLHFSDPNPVLGKTHSYRVRYIYGAGAALRRSASSNPVVLTDWRDSDGDGLPDWWERLWNLNPNDASDGKAWNPDSGATAADLYGEGATPGPGGPPAPANWKNRLALRQSGGWEVETAESHSGPYGSKLVWEGDMNPGVTVNIEREQIYGHWVTVKTVSAAERQAFVADSDQEDPDLYEHGKTGVGRGDNERPNFRLSGTYASNESVPRVRLMMKTTYIHRVQPGIQEFDGPWFDGIPPARKYYLHASWLGSSSNADGGATDDGEFSYNPETNFESASDNHHDHYIYTHTANDGSVSGSDSTLHTWYSIGRAFPHGHAADGQGYLHSGEDKQESSWDTYGHHGPTANGWSKDADNVTFALKTTHRAGTPFRDVWWVGTEPREQVSTTLTQDGNTTNGTESWGDRSATISWRGSATDPVTRKDGTALTLTLDQKYAAGDFFSQTKALLPPALTSEGESEVAGWGRDAAQTVARYEEWPPRYGNSCYHIDGLPSHVFDHTTSQRNWSGDLGTLTLSTTEWWLECNDCLPGQAVTVIEYEQDYGTDGTSTLVGDKKPVHVLSITPGSQPGQTTKTAKFSSDVTEAPGNRKRYIEYLPVRLLVDANRDGNIGENDVTSKERPYRFWLNNDHDKGGTVDGSDWEEDDYNDGQHDFDKGTIDWKRDLEDFARLWISFKGITEMVKQTGFQLQLEWKPNDGSTNWPTADGNPAIKLYQAVEADGGKKYVEEDTWAAQQLAAPYNATLGQVGKGAPLILPLSQVTLANLTETNPNLYLLFEGVTEGKGRLVLNLIKSGQKIGEYPALYLDIKPIKKMYERWSVGNVGTAGVNYNIWPASSPSRVGDALPAPTTDAEKDYVLLVHGWNMQEWEKENYAETAFKRLWHLGYKGHFGLYEWPTFFFTGSAPSLDNFDASEERAWNSAPGLLNLIGQLNQTHSGRVRLLAHSMGNVVAGEALRLANRQRVVHTYVASQAAIAAHSYDATVPAMSFSALIAGPSTPNCYAHYWQTGLSSFPGDWPANTPSYLDPQYTQGAAGSFVNYFNPVDYALTSTFGWETDQQTKPNYHYDYAPSGSDRGFIYRPINPFNNRNLRFPADTREIFSYADEAQSHALGSQTGVGGVFGGQIDLQSKFSFGSQHKYHSGQFRSTNMLRRGYWKQLLESYGLESNP